MPTISMFYGILVAMLFEDNDRHHLPHIHVRYSGSEENRTLELPSNPLYSRIEGFFLRQPSPREAQNRLQRGRACASLSTSASAMSRTSPWATASPSTAVA
jgi:hypothetical protein